MVIELTLSQLMEVQVKMYGEQLLVAVAKTTLGLLRKPHYLLHPVTANDNSSGDKLDGMIYFFYKYVNYLTGLVLLQGNLSY